MRTLLVLRCPKPLLNGCFPLRTCYHWARTLLSGVEVGLGLASNKKTLSLQLRDSNPVHPACLHANRTDGSYPVRFEAK